MLGAIDMAQIKRVTIQDIADACGLSRNTISKIFNGRGAVPEATKAFVLAKAREMGYLQALQPVPAPAPAAAGRNIALLTHSKPSLHNFGSLFITNFTDQICRSGYNLKIFEIGDEEYAQKVLPPHYVPEDISAIIMIELFDREYTRMVCSLGLPVLLVDSYADAYNDLLECDLVYMENYASTIAMTRRMIEAGARSLGFVGDVNHCGSFRERWNGFRSAMVDANLPIDTSLCILADDSEPYGEVDWMLASLQALPRIPDGFVCCNDFIAIRTMQALRAMGLSVPEDVMITGFDGTNEAALVNPSVTTARIPCAEIGRLAADMLMEHIVHPGRPCQTAYVRTTPIWRESTRD